MPDGRQIKKIRYALETQSESFLDIVDDRKFKQFFGGLKGETLKRAPLGYAPDHPMIEHLKRKHFFVSRSFKEEECLKADFAKKAADAYLKMMPFTRWLRDVSR